MLAFVVAGVLLGVLARVLWRRTEKPSLLVTVPVGVAGAAAGGVVLNLVVDESWLDLNPWSFTAACVVPMVLLGLLEGGVGRR